MSKSIAGKIKISTFDELVGDVGDGITEIALEELHDFEGHPFRVVDDEKMEETVESIRQHGVLMPGIVRPRKEGDYEIIAGHRRKHACEIAGLTTMPVFVRDYSDDEATIIMVDTNIQREDILPSEKARAYQMKYEAMKHQGSKAGGKTLEKIGEDAGESAKTIQRYIYLARLTDEMMDMVDEKKIPFVSGVELSFLSTEDQSLVYGMISEGVGISTLQASQIREYGEKGELTRAVLELLLVDEKPKPRRFTMKSDRISEYFGEEVSNEEIEETIIRLLDEWKAKGGQG